MPHYKDGTEAKIGDVVRGKGYNVKDKDQNLREFVGTVVGITPGSTACNIQVAHVVVSPLPFGVSYSPHRVFQLSGVIGCGAEGGAEGSVRVGAVLELEYGQTDHFEKIG
jgi:hypothetical protein